MTVWVHLAQAASDNPDDIKVLVEGIQKAVKMVTKTKSFESIGARLTNSLLPGCETLAKLSDEYWECFARNFCGSMFNVVGTCRMGKDSEDAEAVVDSRLRYKN
ncbi:unnamed protein product [Allacma fusca]|uniref:Glucose-methanol-choline oxidoreductase C-terminal domain-containing protein n=1 Tax=Allacma fusca TaxID=39272 RepID=A0A8J2PLB4_9HEXA|nr:unnamed protein product [Allacma fusca]